MENICRVNNFEVFYSYFLLFSEMLRRGEFEERISKAKVAEIMRNTNSVQM